MSKAKEPSVQGLRCRLGAVGFRSLGRVSVFGSLLLGSGIRNEDVEFHSGFWASGPSLS